ncbi:MAG: hypothetical protein JSS37_10795 [Proteobacteria bacterium]|nr:hypothetical protein [Pseudomonadota bacterium]
MKTPVSDGQARRNQVKKRSPRVSDEHFEPDFNAAWSGEVVFQSFSRVIEPQLIQYSWKILEIYGKN